MSDWHEDVLRHKYEPLPEDAPRYRKKSQKKRVRSDHKHEYETVCIDAHSKIHTRSGVFPSYHICKRCKVCGRLQDVAMFSDIRQPPEGMPLYEVDDYFELAETKNLSDEKRVR